MRSSKPPFETLLHDLEGRDFSQPRDQSGAELHCDLVMKGGITSGVVYPLAVLKLAQSRRFHSIGGTSAGAIAAAATAAAEYGRATRGFNQLAAMVGQLQTRGFIANLFQPAPELRPLMQALFIGLKLKRRVNNQIDELPARMEIAGDALKLAWAVTIAPKGRPAIIGGLTGVLIGVLLAGGWIVSALAAAPGAASVAPAIWGVLMIALCWWVGNLVGMAVQLVGTGVPGHYYGLCDGRPVADHARHRLIPARGDQSPALTEYLAQQIDQIAGMPAGQPLTFGRLRLNHQPQVDLAKKIELNMVTTNLNQGQPYVFPFTDTQFLFSEQEFGDLFPAYVVQHMVARAQRPPQFATPIEIVDERGRAHQLHFLPTGDDMPVIVGTRMSLSFPILLSAVPLWTVSAAALASAAQRQASAGPFALGAEHMRRNWFSDGGICSNFPIHFYDKLFPTPPTFGINLDQLPSGAGEAGAQPYEPDFQWQQSEEFDPASADTLAGAPAASTLDRATGIYLPTAYPQDRPRPVWQPLEGTLSGFLGAIVNTGLFYRDIMQSHLPSYNDRIVTIFLGDQEGGLNLDMPPATIQRIALKGYNAGNAIEDVFDFNHHRWVRLRLLLGKLEEQMIALRDSLQIDPAGEARAKLEQQLAQLSQLLQNSGMTRNAIQQLIDAELAAFGDPARRYPYPRDAAWRDESLTRLYVLLLMIQVWGGDATAVFQLNRLNMPSADVQDGDDHIRLRVTPDL